MCRGYRKSSALTKTRCHVEKLNLEVGEIAIAGQIEAMVYEEDQLRRRGFWSRLF